MDNKVHHDRFKNELVFVGGLIPKELHKEMLRNLVKTKRSIVMFLKDAVANELKREEEK